MFSKDLEQLMLDAQKEAYGDGLDPDAMHPYMWACKPHYYSSGLSFYNFPYAFGGLFSKGLYAIYQEQPEGFVEKYQELIACNNSDFCGRYCEGVGRGCDGQRILEEGTRASCR